MKQWPGLPEDDELERADSLLDQADALLRRHRPDDRLAEPATEDWTAGTEFDDDDLPILTEIVEDFELPAGLATTSTRSPSGFEQEPSTLARDTDTPPMAAPTPSTRPEEDALSARLAERLIELDTEIAREIGAWVAAEMPQILARELDQLASRVQAEMQAHLRATLLPKLSARVGRLLDPAADPVAKPDRPPGD